jgi:hypothetical protein
VRGGARGRRPAVTPVRRAFPGSRARAQHGLLLGAVLASIGIGVLLFGAGSVPDSGLIGAINLAIAAGLVVFALRTARDRTPHLILDRRGIWYRDWGIGPVPRSQIADVYASGARVQAFVTIELCDAEKFLARLPRDQARRLKANRLARLPELRIPNGALDAPFHEIVAAIQEWLAEDDRTDR